MVVRKDFDEWNKMKKKIDNKINFLEIKERQVWWASVGLNIGDEENGKKNRYERPVLILKNFNNRICLTLPISSKSGDEKFYHKIKINGLENFVILSQIKLMSVKRLRRFISKLYFNDFNQIKERVIDLIK
ncbi:type II toxin-antitoxin system PemK/MazF family toxin [Candidatus Parcubacteria bacterium]|nr:type II toxin-antitoxin system PemK/MazF family toxin [Candidatus Parcubacteria bacterium]